MTDILIRFRLVGDVARALYEISAQEMRSPRDQVRYFLLQELERLGWLKPVSEQDSKRQEATAEAEQ